MFNLRSIPLCALAVAVLCSTALAQSAPAARILSPIDENQLVTLRGNVNPLANSANDRGSVNASMAMSGLTLVLSRSAEQQAAFDAFVQSQYDSSSPNFHQWISPTEIGTRFGPVQTDINTISSWLTSHGLTVAQVSPDHMSITFSGTAAQVQTAFHTSIHNLSIKGVSHYANTTDPQVPAALSSVVIGVKGMHNFFPHPLHRIGSAVQYNSDLHGWQRLQTSPAASLAAGGISVATATNKEATLKPNFYYPVTNSTAVEEDVSPYDFASIYNLPSGWPTTSTVNGTGQTIAIIGTSDISLTDVSNFKTAFGLPAGKTPVIAHGLDGDPGICTSSTNACSSGDLDENSLDVEWSGAVAPGAQIVLVTDAYNSQSNPTNDPIYDGAQWTIDNAYVSGSAVYGARIMSVSYGSCELINGTAANVAYNNLWQTAASAGFAVFVATGDSGSPSCDQGGDYNGNPYEAQYGLSVNGLSSTPYNTAVGGTDLNWCAISQSSGTVSACTSADASKYWNVSNSAQHASAKGYVPEIAWNDTCMNPALLPFFQAVATGITTSPSNTEAACNFVYNYWPAVNTLSEQTYQAQFVIAPYVDTVGGSGGASNCVVNTTSFTSTSTSLGTCTSSDTSTGASYGNLTLASDGWPKPSWQTSAQPLGVPNDGVRDLPDVSFFSGDGLLDSATLICVSNDGATCTSLSATGTNASGGAEEVGGTSVATPEMAGVMALLNQKAGGASGSPNAELYTLAGKQTYSNCSSENGTTSDGCYFNDIDQGTNSMPCAVSSQTVEGGAIYSSSVGGYVAGSKQAAIASPNCAALNSGDLVGTLVSSGTTPAFNGVTGYDQATGLGSLNIANVVNGWPAATSNTGSATATVSVSLGSVTSINTTQSLAATVKVSGSLATPTGTVQFLIALDDQSYSASQTLSGGSASFTVPAGTFSSAGTATITATYSGDVNYALAIGSATVTVTSPSSSTGTFSLGAIGNPATIAPGSTATATATVSSSSGYAGTVSFNCTLTTSPSGAAHLPSCSGNTVALSAAATSGTASFAVTTTAATTTSSELVRPKGLNGKQWMDAGGGAVLALLVFFGIPSRRRTWRAMIGMVVLVMALGVMSACGGGGGSSTTTVPGTTAGTYTFTVTPSGSPAASGTVASQTFTVTVN